MQIRNYLINYVNLYKFVQIMITYENVFKFMHKRHCFVKEVSDGDSIY